MSTGCIAQGHFSWLSWLLVLELKAFLLYLTKIKMAKDIHFLHPLFPQIVSTESFFFLDLKIVENSNSCHKFHILYLINWIFAAETIHGRKLFKEVQYPKKVLLNMIRSKHNFVKQDASNCTQLCKQNKDFTDIYSATWI